MADIIPGHKTPAGIQVLELIKTGVILFETSSAGERNTENELEEPREHAGVRDDDDGLVRMFLCNRCEGAYDPVRTLLRCFTSRNDVPETEAVISFPLSRKLRAQILPGQPLKQSHMPLAQTCV